MTAKITMQDLTDTMLDDATGAAMHNPADQLSWRAFNPQPEPPAINTNWLSLF